MTRSSLSWAAAALAVMSCPACNGGSPAGSNEDAGVPQEDAAVPDAEVELRTFTVAITDPPQGSFLTSIEVEVSGATTDARPDDVLTLNGQRVALAADGTWSTTLPLDFNRIANPLLAQLADPLTGELVRDRITVVAGDSIADGELSPHAIAVRIGDVALDKLETLVSLLVVNALDFGTLIPVGTELIDDECFISGGFLGCLGSADVEIDDPAPSVTGFRVSLDARTGYLFAMITVQKIEVNLHIDGHGLVPNCSLSLQADEATFSGNFSLRPDANDPSFVDVSSVSPIAVQFRGFDTSFGGICGAPIIGDIIQGAVPDIEALAIDGIAGFLVDPDGDGPADDPISAAAQDALAGISIAGPIADALMVRLDAPLFDIPIDEDGLTLGSDGRVMATMLGAGAPDLPASFHAATEFPLFGPTTPGGQSFGFGLCVSPSFFNQLFKATVESGLLNTEADELFDQALTAGSLGVFLPAFRTLPADEPLKFVVAAGMAPFLTGAPGPNGELGELLIPNLAVEVRSALDDTTYVGFVVDAKTGLDLTMTPEGELAPTITEPTVANIAVVLVTNPLGVEEASLMGVVPTLVTGALPELGDALQSFPLPSFFDLRVEIVEVAREGAFYSIYANLN